MSYQDNNPVPVIVVDSDHHEAAATGPGLSLGFAALVFTAIIVAVVATIALVALPIAAGIYVVYGIIRLERANSRWSRR